MSRERLECLEGDLVGDGHGNTGIVRKCFNRTTREHYLKVLILSGPLQKQWRPTSHFQPQLNHEGGTVPNVCLTCGRPFLAVGWRFDQDEGRPMLPREDKCSTCSRHQRSAAQRDRDRRVTDAGETERKTRHHAR